MNRPLWSLRLPPPNAGIQGVTTVAPEIDRIFSLLLWMTGVVFVLVQATRVLFIVRHRSRAGERAGSIHGIHVIEIVWTVIPALILAFLAFHSQRV